LQAAKRQVGLLGKARMNQVAMRLQQNRPMTAHLSRCHTTGVTITTYPANDRAYADIKMGRGLTARLSALFHGFDNALA
jgi:hypothetical protein